MFVWAAAFILEVTAGVGIFAHLFIPKQLNIQLFIVGFFLGMALQRLSFVICKLKIDQMRGQPPNWRELLRSLFMTMVLIACSGYVYFTGMFVNVENGAQ